MRNSNFEYPVTKVFRYNNRTYQPGMWWKPTGVRNDKNLIDNRFVDKARARVVLGEDAPVQYTQPEIDYSEYTNKKLREMLAEKELPVYGTKSELIHRLETETE